jgi:general secretion pathway protein A
MPVLEQVRILSNLETDKEKLLQIVLVGQLNLQPLLKAPQMRQLDQRVSIRYQLRPLTRDEVAAYVTHRIGVAGPAASVAFQPRALDELHRRTKGIPRLVNLVCDRALLTAFAGRGDRVSADHVLQAAENLELTEESPSKLGWFRRRASVYVAAAGASVSLGVAGGMVALHAPSDADGTRTAAVAPDIEMAAPLANHEPRYSVLTASFPIADLLREGSNAAIRFEMVVEELRTLGYEVRSMDVNLPEHGEYRRVLVGDFATLSDAKAEAHRVHQTPTFANAQVIRY